MDTLHFVSGDHSERLFRGVSALKFVKRGVPERGASTINSNQKFNVCMSYLAQYIIVYAYFCNVHAVWFCHMLVLCVNLVIAAFG